MCCTLSFGLQNSTRYICHTKQLINDWSCQQSFVDDALLIPKLNHKTALHHHSPVNPTSNVEQANVFVCYLFVWWCTVSDSELMCLCILKPQRWTVYKYQCITGLVIFFYPDKNEICTIVHFSLRVLVLPVLRAVQNSCCSVHKVNWSSIIIHDTQWWKKYLF